VGVVIAAKNLGNGASTIFLSPSREQACATHSCEPKTRQVRGPDPGQHGVTATRDQPNNLSSCEEGGVVQQLEDDDRLLWKRLRPFFNPAASSTEFANFPAAAGDGVDEDVERFHLLGEASGVAGAGSADAGTVSAWRGVSVARVRSNSGDKPTSKSNLYFNSDRKKQ
jgi:hypothetical protein